MGRSSFGQVQLLPSGRFRARFKVKGVTHNAPHTFTHKTHARAWLAKQQVALSEGVWKSPEQIAAEETEAERIAQSNSVTVADWAKQWCELMEQRDASPSTIRSYKSHLRAHILPALGAASIMSLSKTDIKAWHTELGTRVSKRVQRNAYMALSSMMTAALQAEVITENPVKIPGAMSKIATKNPSRVQVATPEQVQAIADVMPENMAITVLLAAWCCLRYGEVAELRRKDINLDEQTLSISRSVKRTETGTYVVGSPKTRSGIRTIAIPPNILEPLQQHLTDHVPNKPEALIVHAPTSERRHLSNNTLHRHYDKATTKTGLPGFKFHDLRHTGLTMAGQAGATLAELMHRAGHANPEMVMIYQHATQERDKALAERMATLSQTTGPNP